MQVALELEDDHPRDECGLFGIYSPEGKGVARQTYYGLYALQHRGQESAGIAVSDGTQMHLHKAMGLVAEVFRTQDLEAMPGQIAIGHVRYSTTGSSHVANAQPLTFRYLQGQVALAHNGNLVNANELRRSLEATGSVFQTTTDSEVIVNLIARYGQSPIEEALMKCMIDLKGSYSLLIMTENKLIAVRDPYGVRPLCLGQTGDGGYVLASESCALDLVGARFVRDVTPGEIVVIDSRGLSSIQTRVISRPALCIFELIYLARPDSTMDGQNVSLARLAMGKQLAREHPVTADLVVSVPDSGTTAALGYAEAAGLPFREGLIKNRYIGRTFIQPNPELRSLGVRLKLNPIREILKGQRVVLVDDSIVRGTTSGLLVQMLREAGAREVHMVVSSPPILYSCYYGIDTPTRQELIAAQHDLEAIRQQIGADTLHYLSLDGLLAAVNIPADNFCTACFTGQYLLGVPADDRDKLILEGGC